MAVERYKKRDQPAGDGSAECRKAAGLMNMKVVYDETPEQMVKGLVPLLEAGANIVGACCGSTPDHIRAFQKERWTNSWNQKKSTQRRPT